MTELSIGLVIGQLHRGGAEAQLVKLATGLHERGHRVFVYCLSDVTSPHDATLREAGIPLRIVSRTGSRIIPRWMRLRSLFQDDALDLAQAFLLGPIVQTALALLGRRRPLFVASNRNTKVERPVIRRLMETWAFGQARAITVNSSPALDNTRQYYHVSLKKLQFIPNGIERMVSPLPSQCAARARFNLPADSLMVLGIFRLHPQKNLELFCSITERVFAHLENGHCVIAGDGPLRDWLHERIRRSPCPTQFTLLGASDEIPTLLAAGDLLLLTSRFEGMPNVVLEAMSAGLPVVATRVGGLPDLVQEGSTGHLCPDDDETQLVASVRQLLLDPATRSLMGKNARRRVENEFSVGRMVDSHVDLYIRLTGELNFPPA